MALAPLLRQVVLQPRAAAAPAGNFTTLNPAVKSTNVVLSGGNLTCTGAENHDMVASIGTASAGMFRFEFTPQNLAGGTALSVGVCNASKPVGPNSASWIGGDANSSGIYDDGHQYYSGAPQGNDLNVLMAVGTTFGVEVDFGTGHLWFVTATYRSTTPLALPTGALFAYCGMDVSGASCTFNFGASAWVTPVTSGFDHTLA